MDKVYTIGFTKKTAAQFFGALKNAGIKRVVDVRLKSTSQLAGFAKAGDLEFFLDALCGAEYVREPLLAPTDEILDAFKKRKGDWAEYEDRFLELLREREVEQRLDRSLLRGPAALLCSEPTPEHCHRRLVLEYLLAHWGDFTIVHL